MASLKHKKSWQACTGLMLLIFLSAWKVSSDSTATTTPYPLQYPAYFGNRINIPGNNPLTEEAVRLGRMLFYETRLSANNLISCGTCHQQQHAFTDGKTFSQGHDGTLMERNTMTLANLLWVRNFFWDGRVNDMENQALVPMTAAHEMGQTLEQSVVKLKLLPLYRQLFRAAFGSDTITGEMITKALGQFERTLVSCNSTYDKYMHGDYQPTESETNGIILFFTNPDPARKIRGAGCGHCHGGPKTFTELYHNNGLDSFPKDAGRETLTGMAIDRGRFRTVTLRNIALTAPYMHDGRFKKLQEVVDHYSDNIKESEWLSIVFRNNSNMVNGKQLSLTSSEKRDVIAFLNMLTDSSFIQDKRFSNPFDKRGNLDTAAYHSR